MREEKTLEETIQSLPPELKQAMGRAVAFLNFYEEQLWKAHSEKFDFELWTDNKFHKLLEAILPNEVALGKIKLNSRQIDAERMNELDNKKKEELLKKLQESEDNS